MSFFSLKSVLPGCALLACGLAGAQDVVRLTPAVVAAGSPVLIRVDAPATAKLSGDWLDRPLHFFRGADAWFALAGVDVQAEAGVSTLHISQMTGPNFSIELDRKVEIHAAHYRTGTITVAPKFVEPPPEALAQIKAEADLKKQVFAASAPEPLWSGDFAAPVKAQATDSFGTRRIYNGKLASIHQGMDFRAATGTPVHAANSGTVVLARKLYYEGNCVVVDHGLGLFTISMHFSRIDVREGQRVTKGQMLGLSGATGRVTGPHLHWAVRWESAYLDPAKLLKMELGEVR